MERLVWTPREVVDVDGPRAMLRAYLEQRDVRELTARASTAAPISAACDIGCGFGRLTPVLTEFADRVIGFEREADLLRIARSLQPSIEFRSIDSLSHLPADDASFTFGWCSPCSSMCLSLSVRDGDRRTASHRRADWVSAALRGDRRSARSGRSHASSPGVHLRTPGDDVSGLARSVETRGDETTLDRARLPATGCWNLHAVCGSSPSIDFVFMLRPRFLSSPARIRQLCRARGNDPRIDSSVTAESRPSITIAGLDAIQM